MSTFERELPGQLAPASQPGAEVAGPPLTALVEELTRTAEGLERLYRRAVYESRNRYTAQVVPFQTDASGNATVKLYEVPGGASASLVLVAIDEAGVTPQAPDTRATLSLSIVAGSGAAVAPLGVGALLDCLPQTPGVATQLPVVFIYGDPMAAPRLVGPLAFYLVVANANASKQCAARIGVCIEQPEP